MDKIVEILKKQPAERTLEEYKYLLDNYKKLSEEQLIQLTKENSKPVEEEVKAVSKKETTDDPPKENKTDLKATQHKEVLEKLGQHVWKTMTDVETKDLGDGEIEAIVASDSLDRHGDVLDIKGLDLSKFKQNPVVAWSHDYHALPVAQAVSIKKTADGKVIARMKFAIAEYDFAKTVYNLYKGGYLRAFSIGFIAKEIDDTDYPKMVYTKSEMLEFSAVLIPANAEALMLAKKKGIDTVKLLTYTEGMLTLKEILQKETGDLTVNEIKHLKEHASELTEEEKKKFSSVLEEKDIAKEVGEMVDKKLTEFKTEFKSENVNLKNISNQFTSFKTARDDEKKAEIFKQWLLGVYTKDMTAYRQIRKELGVIGKSAMNEATDSAILPPSEFIAEVERLENAEFGIARKFVTLRRTTNSSVTVILGDDDVDIYDTAEGVAKTSTKLSYDQQLLTVRKYAAILPSTDELLEDSAIDLFNDATRRFARAYSRKEDEIVFTRATGAGSLYPGILHAAGVNVIDIGDQFTDLTSDHLNEALYGVPSPSRINGRYFLNAEILGLVQRLKDPTTSRPIWNEGINGGAGPTIWGRPYELVDVLPNLSADADSVPFMIYGDLRYSTLVERTGLKVDMFNTGGVTDPDDAQSELNLLTQDMQAMRVVKRMNARCRFPAAFSVIGTTSHVS